MDFAALFAGGGWGAVRRVLASYGAVEPDFARRIGFFAWVAPLFDVVYGLETDQAEHVEAGIAGVERRLGLVGVVP
ncbi:MAG: hypothetical protein ACKVVT_18530 [Dehalococcoidia bacterium]